MPPIHARFRQFVERSTCPEGLTERDGLRYWQERTMGLVVLLAVVLGSIAYVPSLILSVLEGRYFIAVLDTVVMAGVVALLVFRRAPYSLRAGALVGASYLVGMALFHALGPFGAGPVWLFAPPVFAGILMGRRWALLGLIVNGVFLVAVGLYLHLGTSPEFVYPLGKWVVISVNFLLLNAVAALGAAQVVKGLEGSLKEEQEARAELDLQHRALERAHKDLARESDGRRRAAEALRTSEERFRRAFDNIPDIVILYDGGFRAQHMNRAAREFGSCDSSGRLSGSERDGRTRLRQVHLPILEEVARTKEVHRAETSVHFPNGDPRSLIITCVPLANDNGDLRELLCLTHDQTEQAALENRFRQAQKLEAVGTLAGGIAHDFNNVLAAIIGYSQLAADALPADSRCHADIDQVIAAAERGSNLVRQILTFSRRAEQERQPVELQFIVKEALKLLRPTLPSTIEIAQEIGEGCKPIKADPTQMHQVLMNLCTNAYHAMQETGGRLTIRLESVEIDAEFAEHHPRLQPGPHARLTVSDTGHGMKHEVRDRIFEPFFTTKGQGEGSGLGLATVHGIVTSHSGTISVYSEPGQGTAFHVYLPCVEAEETGESRRVEPVSGGTERILVVDDEADLASLMARVLRGYGYRVTMTTKSSRALDLFEAQPDEFDLIVTDFTMPAMTGIELARAVTHVRPGFPIVLMSGIEGLVRDADANAPVRAFVRKPVPPSELARVVRDVLDAG